MRGRVPHHADLLQEIVRAGIQATSPDNSQPWRFRVGENKVDLSVDRQRIGLFFDAGMAATLMSCGAVIENMMLESARHGVTPTVTYAQNKDPTDIVATIQLQRRTSKAEDLANYIPLRATHRGLYRKQTLVSETAKRQLESAAEVVPHNRILWCESTEQRRLIMRAAFAADLIRYTHPQIHRDFHAKLRFGANAEATLDGLADDTLGIERVLLPFLRLLSPWPLARSLNYLGLHYFMAWRGCWLPMQTAPTLATLVCGPSVDYLDMGRALQRTWLAATAAQLSFQPIGALPLLLIRLHQLHGAGLPPEQTSRLRRLDQMWRSAFSLADSPDRLTMIFRLGHATRPPAHSRRRPLASFFKRHDAE